MVLDTSALIGYNVNMKDINTNWTIAIIGSSAAVSCVVYLYAFKVVAMLSGMLGPCD
tara:strand:- start:73 stop:243 length:171 start_codon:yes stop_codon:yes gene_type:complete